MPAHNRLAELLTGLSLAADLGVGAPLESSLRACALATELASRAGLRGAALSAVYYASLLRHLGCTAWAHEATALLGDDHELVRTFEGVDAKRPSQIVARLAKVAPTRPMMARIASAARVLAEPSALTHLASAQCAQADALAGDLGMPDAVRAALAQIYERYDGRGAPRGIAGRELAPATGWMQAGHLIEILHRQRGGSETRAEWRSRLRRELEARQGGELAPEICKLVIACSGDLWEPLETREIASRVLAAEPAPHIEMTAARLADIALAFGRFADLKTPHTLNHSSAVASVAAGAAAGAGWPTEEVENLRCAALLHDLGAVSVSNATWEHKGALGAGDWEAVRLHAYYSERILARTAITLPLAAICGAHHERLDGSGYHRSARGDAIARSARLLAAADVFVALGEARPHRPAFSAARRSEILREEAQGGRLCRAAVALLLEGAPEPRRRSLLPAGLTEREVEVLGLLAEGLTNKEIAVKLGLAVRTVKHHAEHVYEKIGASGRAGAALFAVRNDLVRRADAPSDRPFDP